MSSSTLNGAGHWMVQNIFLMNDREALKEQTHVLKITIIGYDNQYLNKLEKKKKECKLSAKMYKSVNYLYRL